MRRYGKSPEAGIRYKARPGAYGVILRGDQALLALTEEEGEELLLPGGGIDPGENAIRALHREAMEETGWRIRPIRRVGAYRRFVWMPTYQFHAEKICHIYLCAPVRKLGAPSEPDHHPVWVDTAVAAAMLSGEGDRALFLEALRLAG